MKGKQKITAKLFTCLFIFEIMQIVYCATDQQSLIENFVTQFVNSSNSIVTYAEAPINGLVQLPCDLESSREKDRIKLIMWYKAGRISPIYSYDVRAGDLATGKHWFDTEILGNRSSYDIHINPSILRIDRVTSTDGGLYRCRIDYVKTPSKNFVVNFTIVVPVEKIAILDKEDKHIRNYQIGPFNEGQTISITCVASGGEPPPRVTWWQDNTLLDDTSTILTHRRVGNSLRLDPVRRLHFNQVFTCKAENSDLFPALLSDVKLLINLRPLSVKLKGDNKPLSAGQKYELICEVRGAIPTPTITWWKGSSIVNTSKTMATSDVNVTVSTLKFLPCIEDSGKFLSCRGEQSSIPESGMEDGWKLDIHHVPIVSLELGSTFNTSIIKEGVDVYLECNIKSNPWIYQIRWIYNDKQLYNNAPEGILVSNQSLVLQSVTKSMSGNYSCIASNKEGDGESNQVQLDVKFPPSCRPGQIQTFGISLGEISKIPCELEANPVNVNFTWSYNTTDNKYEVIDKKKVVTETLRSIVQYTAQSANGFGTLSCWGENEVGMQSKPCVFYLIQNEKPDMLRNCTITNVTSTSFMVTCIEGFNGGLQQEFHLKIYTTEKKLISTVSTRMPSFLVAGLEGGRTYEVYAMAVNKKGPSAPVKMSVVTAQSEHHIGLFTAYLSQLLQLTPSIAMMICFIIVMIITIPIVCVMISRNRAEKRINEENEMNNRIRILPPPLPDVSHEGDEQNPDIIPQGGNEYVDDDLNLNHLNAQRSTYPLRVPNIYGDKHTLQDIRYADKLHDRIIRHGGSIQPPILYSNDMTKNTVVSLQRPDFYATMNTRCTKRDISEIQMNMIGNQHPYYTAQVTLPRHPPNLEPIEHKIDLQQVTNECQYPVVAARPIINDIDRF